MTPTFDSEHYNEDLTPKKCYECGCTTFHKKILQTSEDTLGGHVMAFNLSCLDCGILLQFWDTGVYNAEMAWLSNGSGELGR